MTLRRAATLSTCALGMLVTGASAASYDFGVSYSPPAAPAFTARAGVSDVALGGNRFSLSLSSRAAEIGVRRNLPLTALGTLQLGANLAGVYTGQRGVRLGANAAGSLGPVALSASGRAWNTPASAQDPLSVWNQVAVPTAVRGVQADLEAKYRVSRDVIVTLGGELGAQSSAALIGEYRLSSTLSLRAGARGGAGVLGALAGVSYRADALTLTADALVGRDFGFTVSLDAPALIALNGEQAIDVSAYLAYEPWRVSALPLRYGLDASLPLGEAVSGALSLGVRGGSGGIGVRAGYTFTPGSAPPR